MSSSDIEEGELHSSIEEDEHNITYHDTDTEMEDEQETDLILGYNTA